MFVRLSVCACVCAVCVLCVCGLSVYCVRVVGVFPHFGRGVTAGHMAGMLNEFVHHERCCVTSSSPGPW